MSMSARLRETADSIWDAQHAHPFVRGIGDGSLDLDRFRHWLRQDYRYLIDYVRLFSGAILRAPDLETMTVLAGVQHELLHTEMALHRSYAAEFGITEAELENEAMSPTCQGYVDFLLRTCLTGDYAEILGALLPCMWGYAEVGQRLAERGRPDDPRYAAWIDMYAADAFQHLAAWCRDAVDAACAGLPEPALRRVEHAFVTSSRYELAFWEMAWTLETWPHP